LVGSDESVEEEEQAERDELCHSSLFSANEEQNAMNALLNQKSSNLPDLDGSQLLRKRKVQKKELPRLKLGKDVQ